MGTLPGGLLVGLGLPLPWRRGLGLGLGVGLRTLSDGAASSGITWRLGAAGGLGNLIDEAGLQRVGFGRGERVVGKRISRSCW